MEEDGILRYIRRVYVPNYWELRKLVMNEMHNVPYVGNPIYQKIIAVVINKYVWLGLKKYFLII